MHEAHNVLGLVPKPESVWLLDGEWKIPDRPVISYSPAGKKMRFAADSLARELRAIGAEPMIRHADDVADGYRLFVSGFAGAKPCAMDSDSLADDGSYRIDVTDHIEIRARSVQGAFHGVQTLAQAIAAGQGTLPRLKITDRPWLGLRGLMIDLGRLKENDKYYFKLIDFMSKYKFNALFLHLVDDEGAPIELKSHPKLSSNHSFTHDTIKRLIDYAAKRHIEIIPEIEVWGHAGWITDHPEYSEIAEGGPDLCTTNPKTWELVGELLDEIRALFPSKYIHGGCDEAMFGLCPNCKAEVEARGKDYLVGIHLKRTAELIRQRDRIPILWGDILLKYPGSADIVPKYTLINHWDYSAGLSDEPVKFLKDKGFAVLAGSSLVCAGRAIVPRTDSLCNVEDFAQIARKHKIVGINNTIWSPQRYVPDALWYGIAFAAEASWSGEKPDRAGLTASFFKSFFGIDAEDDLSEAIDKIHEIPADIGLGITALWRDKKEFEGLATPEESARHEAFLASIPWTLKTIRACRRKVLRHAWEYSALIYAGNMKKHVCERGVAPGRMVQALESARKLAAEGKTAAASRLLTAQSRSLTRLVKQEKRLAATTERYWDKWRYKDDPKKEAPGENTLDAFKTSDSYMVTLSERLAQAAGKLEKGGAVDWDVLLDE